MASSEPVHFVIVWTEKLDAHNRIVFQWNNKEILAEEAFSRLDMALYRGRSQNHPRVIVLKIHGRLGRDVTWSSSNRTEAVKHMVRRVFSLWYTQAVQAHAALVRQRVKHPDFQ